MTGRTQGPTPRGVHRPITAPALTALVLVQLEPGWYELAAGTSGDAVFAESAPGSAFYEITTTPGSARVARAIAMGQPYGVLI
jgi:hypothetical protein